MTINPSSRAAIVARSRELKKSERSLNSAVNTIANELYEAKRGQSNPLTRLVPSGSTEGLTPSDLIWVGFDSTEKGTISGAGLGAAIGAIGGPMGVGMGAAVGSVLGGLKGKRNQDEQRENRRFEQLSKIKAAIKPIVASIYD